MTNFNTGFILRVVGAAFLYCAILIFPPWLYLPSFSEYLSNDIDSAGYLFIFGFIGLLLMVMGISLIVKTSMALRIAELTTLVGAPLLGMSLVFVSRHSGGLNAIAFVFIILPFYVPVVSFLHWLISNELDKSRAYKTPLYYKVILPAILVVGSYIVALLVFPLLPF